jgi:hypothetical protein
MNKGDTVVAKKLKDIYKEFPEDIIENGAYERLIARGNVALNEHKAEECCGKVGKVLIVNHSMRNAYVWFGDRAHFFHCDWLIKSDEVGNYLLF